ncbi:hypothetical protein PpBr36_08015 [Pyricularia pennisetigena]|uniref:hypothetical protein n=1 Tax=Pyricularia pennisetigena TaxID=1578925 RepID=UPI001151827E|nr:hypothetical protein PpBr36_08015 [Pyricularia pennisetigena]TLS24498.1 hypothetical protein PpBr36_08015 [Pyricularia pennisetigena]
MQQIRIQVEKHGHVDRLAGVEPLLLEAEALNLAKVRRDLRGRDAARAVSPGRTRTSRCCGTNFHGRTSDTHALNVTLIRFALVTGLSRSESSISSSPEGP